MADADVLPAVDMRLAIALDSPERQLGLLEAVCLSPMTGEIRWSSHAIPARRHYRDILQERS